MKHSPYFIPLKLPDIDGYGDLKIKWHAHIDKGIKNSFSIPISLDIYPDVVAEHKFEPMGARKPSHYRCRKCGLRAIRNNTGRYTLHSQSWITDDLTGRETCNELLMRKVLT